MGCLSYVHVKCMYVNVYIYMYVCVRVQNACVFTFMLNLSGGLKLTLALWSY